MSVECYRSRGRNTYYNEGKRISKKVASTLSPKLPKCVSKTKSNMIKNLKKQLKEVMTHREQYKTTSSDLDSRLKSMNDQLDKLQEERMTLIEEVDKREKIIYSKNDEIVERMEVIGRLDSENRELKDTLKKTSEDLKKLKSEYEDLEEDLEDLKEKATIYYNEGQALEKENSVLKQRVINADDTIKVYTDKYAEDMGKADEEISILQEENKRLKSKAEKLEEDNKMLKENFKEMVQLSDNLDKSLGIAIEKSRECLSENKELEDTFSNEKFNLEASLYTVKEDNKRMKEVLQQKTIEESQCEADRLLMQEDIIILRNTAESLRNKISEEKGECLLRVQRAIEDSEGKISRREAQKYERELSDLNSKLRLADEALDELKKAGTLEGKKMSPKAVKKAIRNMKKAGVNIN